MGKKQIKRDVKDMVFCGQCYYGKQYGVFAPPGHPHSNCRHPSEVVEEVSYYSVSKHYRTPCSVKNSNNDCPDFEKIHDGKIAIVREEKPPRRTLFNWFRE